MLPFIMAGAAVVSAGAQLYGAYSSAAASERNADRSLLYSQMNAQSLRTAGLQQAALSNMAAKANAQLTLGQAQVNVMTSKKLAGYNAEMIRQVANYNSLLYAEELNSLYDVNELDTFLAHIKSEQAIGAIRGQAAMSGVIMDQDSNADVVADAMWQTALDDAIREENVRLRANEILNASAKGQWEATVGAMKQLWEAEVSGQAELANAAMAANATLANGAIQGQMAMVDAGARAKEALWSGQQVSANARSQADYYRTSGWINAASTAAQGTASTLSLMS